MVKFNRSVAFFKKTKKQLCFFGWECWLFGKWASHFTKVFWTSYLKIIVIYNTHFLNLQPLLAFFNICCLIFSPPALQCPGFPKYPTAKTFNSLHESLNLLCISCRFMQNASKFLGPWCPMGLQCGPQWNFNTLQPLTLTLCTTFLPAFLTFPAFLHTCTCIPSYIPSCIHCTCIFLTIPCCNNCITLFAVCSLSNLSLESHCIGPIMGFTALQWASLAYNGLQCAMLRVSAASLQFDCVVFGFHWIFIGFPLEFHWISLDFHWIFIGFPW